MCPPYQLAQFEIVYGTGIDKLDEIMTLINDHGIGRKYGKTMTIGEHKYDLEEFKKMLTDNQEFYDEIKKEIINKINQVEIKTEEDDTSEI
jgi:recombination protein RecA